MGSHLQSPGSGCAAQQAGSQHTEEVVLFDVGGHRSSAQDVLTHRLGLEEQRNAEASVGQGHGSVTYGRVLVLPGSTCINQNQGMGGGSAILSSACVALQLPEVEGPTDRRGCKGAEEGARS